MANVLSETQERSRTDKKPSLDLVPVALLEVDAAGRITGANAAAVRLLGRSRTDVLGRAGDDALWAIAGLGGEEVAPRDLPMRQALRGEDPRPMAISMAGPKGERLFLNQSATSVRGADGGVEGAIVALTDMGDVPRARDALPLSEERFRLAVEATGAGVYDVDLATGESIWTAEVFKMLGYPYSPGGRATLAMFYDAVHPDDIEAVRSAGVRLMATKSAHVIEYRIRRTDTGEERWLSAYRRVFPLGRAGRAVGVVFDITGRKRAEERERLLMREVDHRAKNALAVVQSVLKLTPHDDIEKYIASISGRIGAIGRVHTLLAENSWVSASVKTLIEAELAAYCRQAGRIEISGPDATAPPHAAQAITMILHELATNAAKYGALSTPEGRLSIALERSGEDMIINWVEHVPHPIFHQPQPGFGSRLLTTLIEQQLDGSVVRHWGANGLSVRLTAAGLQFVAAPGAGAPREEPAQPHRDLTDRVILLVEDDALVSMALEQVLKDAGGRVRVFHTVEAALSSVRKAPPELAVLDVNLRGVPITPVATELARLRVPFVYVTGYGDDLTELPRGAIVRKPFTPDAVCAALQRAEAEEVFA